MLAWFSLMNRGLCSSHFFEEPGPNGDARRRSLRGTDMIALPASQH